MNVHEAAERKKRDEEFWEDYRRDSRSELERMVTHDTIRDRKYSWQPADTAPFNESVLVFVPNLEHYGPGIYRAIRVNMGTGIRWTSTAWASGRDFSGDAQPTHWMPLPEPPDLEQQAEKL